MAGPCRVDLAVCNQQPSGFLALGLLFSYFRKSGLAIYCSCYTTVLSFWSLLQALGTTCFPSWPLTWAWRCLFPVEILLNPRAPLECFFGYVLDFVLFSSIVPPNITHFRALLSWFSRYLTLFFF